MTTIDILIPFHGDPALLQVAVRSVLDQTDPAWRLVVIDNDYPDPEPGRWVQALGDSRVTYLRNEQNLGVSGNLRRCLEVAESTHFVIMGADDVLHPHYVATARRAVAEHPQATVVQPRVTVIDDRGLPIRPLVDRTKSFLAPAAGRTHVLAGKELATSLLHGNWVYFPALTWNRSQVDGRTFRADMETVFDLDFLMDTIMDGGSLVLLADEAFSYRRHAASVSSVTARDTARFAEEERLFAELAPRLRALGWTAAARAARLHATSRLHALALLPRAVRSGDQQVSRQLLRHATAVAR
ncbi:glycosyltransferase family 2 protein [Marmoricola sp. RAF53]|uniref:glycosyltransferase family 2 protein n=1 Tax=Marmoricola sp. RAF53 TaxID=3233059 RepID=UPI003F95CC84